MIPPGEYNAVSSYNFTEQPVQIYERAESSFVPDRGWRDLGVHRLGGDFGWTPYPGRYWLAAAPVGTPRSRSFARTSYRVDKGDHLVVVLVGSARARMARFIVRPSSPPGFVQVWNVAPQAPAIAVEVARLNVGVRRDPEWRRIASGVHAQSVSRPARLAPGVYCSRVVTASGPRRVLAHGFVRSGTDVFIEPTGRSGLRVDGSRVEGVTCS